MPTAMYIGFPPHVCKHGDGAQTLQTFVLVLEGVRNRPHDMPVFRSQAHLRSYELQAQHEHASTAQHEHASTAQRERGATSRAEPRAAARVCVCVCVCV
jgi:hypothetical protein